MSNNELHDLASEYDEDTRDLESQIDALSQQLLYSQTRDAFYEEKIDALRAELREAVELINDVEISGASIPRLYAEISTGYQWIKRRDALIARQGDKG